MNIRGLTARDITRALNEDGFQHKRTRGSHHVYSKGGFVIVVPFTNLSDTFPIGTLRQIISAAKWTEADLRRLGLLK